MGRARARLSAQPARSRFAADQAGREDALRDAGGGGGPGFSPLPSPAGPGGAPPGGLARLQAGEWDNFRDAEPGKIAHEFRHGTLAVLGEIPHSPYYGTHDATSLFLILLEEYERWTG